MSITSRFEPLAKIRNKQLHTLISSGKRLDGRDFDSYREINVERKPIDKAEGSCIVTIGNTKVLVGIKVEVGEPYDDTPNQGVLTCNSEFTPLAHETFEPGPPGEASIELARVVDRGIRESKAIEVEKLVLIPGKSVHIVFVDIYILNHDGNLIDAAQFAAINALMNAKMANYEVVGDSEVKKTSELKPLPVREIPLSTTMVKIGNTIFVDPTLDEEKAASARISFALNQSGEICALQKGGIGTFSPEEIMQAYRKAKEKYAEIKKKLG